MFIPGETITHRFVIPFAVNEIDYVILSYKQNNYIVLEKRISSGFQDDEPGFASMEITLTQEESLLFGDDMTYFVQLNVFTNNGLRFASTPISGRSGSQYYREAMGEGVSEGVILTPPASGVRTFSVTVPNGTATTTFNFAVDSEGNVVIN